MFDMLAKVDPRIARLYDPPRRVLVDTVALWRVGPPVRDEDRPSLWLRQNGVSLAQRVNGEQHMWFRADTGAWVPFVSYTMRVGPTEIRCQHPIHPDGMRLPDTRR